MEALAEELKNAATVVHEEVQHMKAAHERYARTTKARAEKKAQH